MSQIYCCDDMIQKQHNGNMGQKYWNCYGDMNQVYCYGDKIQKYSFGNLRQNILLGYKTEILRRYEPELLLWWYEPNIYHGDMIQNYSFGEMRQWIFWNDSMSQKYCYVDGTKNFYGILSQKIVMLI